MDLTFTTLKDIVSKPVLVMLKDGNQLKGLIISHSHDEADKEKITRISILESKPFGIPVSILTKNIEELIALKD